MDVKNIPLQRACLMGLVTAILDDQGEKSLREIKDSITDALSHMIEADIMVGDFIDVTTVRAAKQHMEQEMALNEVKSLLK
jgi:hypothetical protein